MVNLLTIQPDDVRFFCTFSKLRLTLNIRYWMRSNMRMCIIHFTAEFCFGFLRSFQNNFVHNCCDGLYFVNLFSKYVYMYIVKKKKGWLIFFMKVPWHILIYCLRYTCRIRIVWYDTGNKRNNSLIFI